MNSFWNLLRNIMAVAGVFFIWCATSTIDFYMMELHQPEPSYTWWMIILGFVLMVPGVVHMMEESKKGS